MTECPFPTFTANRLLQQHRPSHLFHSDRKSRAIRASRIRFRSNPGQILRRNVEAAYCTLQTNAPVAVTDPADNALSP
jgi:hypothetical protein